MPRQWTVSAPEPELAHQPTWNDPTDALEVAERTGNTIWTRPGTGARWIRAKLQPTDDSNRADAEREHRRQLDHPSSLLATSVHAALEATSRCQPGQCAYIAAQLLGQGWTAEPKPAPTLMETSNPFPPPWMAAQMAAYARSTLKHAGGHASGIFIDECPDPEDNTAMDDADRPEVQCPMPDCLESLALEYDTAYTLGPGDLFSAPGGPEDAHSQTWRIECHVGHVILLPEDTAEDHYAFDDTDLARLKDTMDKLNQLAWFLRNDAEQTVYTARDAANRLMKGTT